MTGVARVPVGGGSMSHSEDLGGNGCRALGMTIHNGQYAAADFFRLCKEFAVLRDCLRPPHIGNAS